jgi:hypothetical protein
VRAAPGLAALVAVLACASSQVATLGPRRQARPAGCAVEIVPGAPTGPVVDLASARVKCVESARGDCLDQLRRQTCLAGGDTAYGLTESLDQHITYITATLALRNEPARPGACVPICSPGFDCQAGKCIPLCNPACAATEICNQHRTCEPAPAPGP